MSSNANCLLKLPSCVHLLFIYPFVLPNLYITFSNLDKNHLPTILPKNFHHLITVTHSTISIISYFLRSEFIIAFHLNYSNIKI